MGASKAPGHSLLALLAASSNLKHGPVRAFFRSTPPAHLCKLTCCLSLVVSYWSDHVTVVKGISKC